MEFSPRGFQRGASRPAAQPSVSSGAGGSETPPNDDNRPKQAFAKQALAQVKDGKTIGKLSVLLFFSLVVLAVSIILAISFKGAPTEARIVDTENYQVVALADGQAYFGKITTLTDKYVALTDVYYLNSQEAGSATSNNVQLIKRGCEVHSPQNSMVIYRDQINFWENLRNDGRVAKAIQQWKEQNPEGQDCSQQTAPATPQQSTTPTGTEDTSDTPTDAANGTSPTGEDATSDTPTDTDTETTP